MPRLSLKWWFTQICSSTFLWILHKTLESVFLFLSSCAGDPPPPQMSCSSQRKAARNDFAKDPTQRKTRPKQRHHTLDTETRASTQPREQGSLLLFKHNRRLRTSPHPPFVSASKSGRVHMWNGREHGKIVESYIQVIYEGKSSLLCMFKGTNKTTLSRTVHLHLKRCIPCHCR